MRKTLCLLAALGLAPVHAATLVDPYLQALSSDSVTVLWETDGPAPSRLRFGTDEADWVEAEGESLPQPDGAVIHEVRLNGLTAAHLYHYQLDGGEAGRFLTPPLSQEAFEFAVLSDTQSGNGTPTKLAEVVEAGVLAVAGPEPEQRLSFVLIAGDLVTDGLNRAHWRQAFFPGVHALASRVPLAPVLGNHEYDSDAYFAYFRPQGAEGEGRWWAFDRGNARFIGLDSDGIYPLLPAQQAFLDAKLADACAAPGIDFVFATFHHPRESEAWVTGETPYIASLEDKLARFTASCGKPTVHFHGHTHGYARGQRAEERMLLVNAASASGGLDYWGEEEVQADRDRFTVSLPEYGFVWVEVYGGDDPRFVLRRHSRGDDHLTRDNEVVDEVVIRRHALPPEAPVPVGSPEADPACQQIKLSPFTDPDDEGHLSTHWQLATDCTFQTLLDERQVSFENRVFGEDWQAGDDLTDLDLGDMPADATLCLRARYRDKGLSWSAWSEPRRLHTGPRDSLALQNPGAELGLEGWQLTTGQAEAYAAGECAAPAPYRGERAFAVSGRCAEATPSELLSAVTLPTPRPAALRFGAYALSVDGQDRPRVALRFLAEDGAVLAEHPIEVPIRQAYQRIAGVVAVPEEAAQVALVLGCDPAPGATSECFFDEVFLDRVGPEAGRCTPAEDSETPWPLPDAAVEDGALPDAAVEDGALPDAAVEDGALPDAEDTALTDATPEDSAVDAAPDNASSADGCQATPGQGGGFALLGLLALLVRRRRAR